MRGAAVMAITGLGIIAPGLERPDQALGPASAPMEGWFQLATALPGRGYKRLPSGCQYLLAAARSAIADGGDHLLEVVPERRGAVVGTNNAGASVLESMDRTIIAEGAEKLSPTIGPFMAMSLFSSRLSPEHQLNGFNLTANSPGTAGLEAMQIAARALVAARASVLLVGATEEAPPPAQFGAVADVGAAVLVCETPESAEARNAAVYGTCSVYGAFIDPSDVTDTTALDRLGKRLEEAALERIDAVLDESPVGIAVAHWLRERMPDTEIITVGTAPDAGCLTPVRRVIGQLATASGRPARRAVLAASAQGNVALAYLTVL